MTGAAGRFVVTTVVAVSAEESVAVTVIPAAWCSRREVLRNSIESHLLQVGGNSLLGCNCQLAEDTCYLEKVCSVEVDKVQWTSELQKHCAVESEWGVPLACGLHSFHVGT